MRPKHKNWLLLGCFSIVWTASLAQGENHNDSLSPITHIPVIEDSASVSVTAASVAVKRSFFKKFLDYFNDANKEKKNKKFDFSVIGGQHYSSDTTRTGLGSRRTIPYRPCRYTASSLHCFAVWRCVHCRVLSARCTRKSYISERQVPAQL